MSACKEALQHGPANAAGRCPWCGAKLYPAVPAPRSVDMTDLTEAYGRTYDPDFDALAPSEIRRRHEMGQDA